MGLKVLSATEIRKSLSIRRSLAAQRDAFIALRHDDFVGGSLQHPGTTSDSFVFVHTGLTRGATGITCKFGVQIPSNSSAGIATVQGLVTVLDADTGVPLACMDGAEITTMRTAHGVLAAADLLARKDATEAAIIGSGAQARELALHVSEIRDITKIRIWSPTKANRERLALEVQELTGIDVQATETCRQAVEGAQIVATATLSLAPVIDGTWLAQGATVLTLGSYEADKRELDLNTTARANLVVVDDVSKAVVNAGCVVEALNAGVLSHDQLVPVGDIWTGTAQGRRNDEQIIVFHSLGFGSQDAAAAWAVYQGALENNYGVDVPF